MKEKKFVQNAFNLTQLLQHELNEKLKSLHYDMRPFCDFLDLDTKLFFISVLPKFILLVLIRFLSTD